MKHALYISRSCMDYDQYAFVIHNTRPSYRYFSEGSAFFYNFDIEISENFEEKTELFLKELNQIDNKELEVFQNRYFEGPHVLFLCIS
jgi:chloramphenicol O-acetyltransferase